MEQAGKFLIGLLNNMTEAENKLWLELKNRKIFKEKFRRQHTIDIFIADFYCHKHKLVIEIDGGIHLDAGVRSMMMEGHMISKNLALKY